MPKTFNRSIGGAPKPREGKDWRAGDHCLLPKSRHEVRKHGGEPDLAYNSEDSGPDAANQQSCDTYARHCPTTGLKPANHRYKTVLIDITKLSEWHQFIGFGGWKSYQICAGLAAELYNLHF
jgi:hypothetical protein